MYGAAQHYDDGDDDVPPGFEGMPRRGRLGPQKADLGPPNSHQQPYGYASPGGAAHQQQQQAPSYNGYSYHQQQQQPYPHPSANGGYGNPPPPPPPPLGRVPSGGDLGPQALGGARQFQRALSGSVAAAQQQQPARPAAAPKPQPPGGPKVFAAPDYGEYGNDSDGEYGAAPSMRRKNSSGRLYPGNRGGSCSPAPGPHSSSSSPSRPPGSSYARPAPALPPAAAAAAVAAAAAAASSTATPSPQGGAKAAAAGDTSTPARPSASPEPDYGEYDADEEYGQESSKGGRRRTRPGQGGSGPRSSSRGPTPDHAVAAARQALAGITPPRGARPHGSRRPHGSSRQRPRRPPMTAERTAELESELEALRARLAEAEAREVEACMAVINLSSDNSSLQAQLSGMRQQKQQLEQMLLFGSDQQDSEEGSQYTGSHSSYSGQSEGAADGEDWGAAAAGAEAEAGAEAGEAPEQQPGGTAVQEGASDASLGTLGFIEAEVVAGQDAATAPAAAAGDAAGDAVAGGDVASEIAEALAAAEAAASAAAAGDAPAAAAGAAAMPSALSLDEEIAQALAAAEAAGEAAVAAGGSSAAAPPDT